MLATDREKWQDGAGGTAAQTSSSYTDLPDENPGDWDSDVRPLSTWESPSHSPLSNSPAKAWMRMDQVTQAPGAVSTNLHTETVGLNMQSSIASFPTSGQPVLDMTMKDMLLSLQSSLMFNLTTLIHKFTSEMQYMEERVQHIEHKMDDCTTTVNDLIDAYKDQAEDNDRIKAKLEDRLIRNNIKIRSISESILPTDLQKICGRYV